MHPYIFSVLVFLFSLIVLSVCVLVTRVKGQMLLKQIPENHFGNSIGTLLMFFWSSGTLSELYDTWTNVESCITSFLLSRWKVLLNRYCLNVLVLKRKTSDQQRQNKTLLLISYHNDSSLPVKKLFLGNSIGTLL